MSCTSLFITVTSPNHPITKFLEVDKSKSEYLGVQCLFFVYKLQLLPLTLSKMCSNTAVGHTESVTQ